MFKFLNILQKFLIIACLVTSSFMFFIKYKMFNVINSIAYLEKQIDTLNNDKNLLNIELTYLTSTERLLALIDKNPKILSDKDIIQVSQLKSVNQFTSLSLAKAKDQAYQNSKLAKVNRKNSINDINSLIDYSSN